MEKSLKIEFVPGCFDSFEGTQEELDKLHASIIKMLTDGEISDNVQFINIDELSESELEEFNEVIGSDTDTNSTIRRLQ